MNKLVPLVITPDLETTRDFYAGTLGWEVTIDMEGYLQVRLGSDDADPELAFSTPAVGQPLGAPLQPFDGDGLVVSVPVADADAYHDAVTGAGASPLTEPTDKPWGWRSFIVTDPNGVHLDFFHEMEMMTST